MQDPCLYDYATIRVVPRVEREEFMNVGVVLSCAARGFLDIAWALNERRLLALDPALDLATVRKHAEAMRIVCAGGKDAGAMGGLTQRERFYWLCAPRSTIIQVSAIHTGLCVDPAKAVGHLLRKLVL